MLQNNLVTNCSEKNTVHNVKLEESGSSRIIDRKGQQRDPAPTTDQEKQASLLHPGPRHSLISSQNIVPILNNHKILDDS